MNLALGDYPPYFMDTNTHAHTGNQIFFFFHIHSEEFDEEMAVVLDEVLLEQASTFTFTMKL